MKIKRKPLFVIWIFTLYPVIDVNGQSQKAEIDTTFESYISEAWSEVKESGFSDSLQNTYAQKIFEYYLVHKNSETAKKAFTSAFTMWGNTGEDKYISEALQSISNDSGIWQQIIMPLANIYGRNVHLEFEDYIELLHNLEEELIESKSLSEVYTRLISHYNDKEEIELVIEYARKLIELNANEWYVNHGLGYLHEIESLQIGQKSPSFSAITLHGETLTLEDLDGKFVILEFWGTWCGPCIPEIPYLQTLWEKHGEYNLLILGIALDDNEDVVTRFIEERDMPWPQILQSDQFRGELVELFNVVGIPRMYLLNPSGEIVARDLRGEEMVSEVNRLISEYLD
ncbi:MAG: TlpA family protein disulfide reductase [Balneolaceae bacterium]